MADLRVNGLNPLAYLGVRAYTPPAMRVFKNLSPTPQDNQNFNLGDLWLNQTTEECFILVALAYGLAVWVPITGGGTIRTLEGNSGGPVGPNSSYNLNVIGDGTTVEVVGDPSTNTLTISAIETGIVSTLTGNTGGAVSPTGGNINVVGDGTTISVAGNPGDSTLTISSLSPQVTWVDVTGSTQAMAVNTGYTADNTGLVTFTLPSTAAYGSVMWVVYKGTGGWQIDQNSGQTIHFGITNTTTGTGGSLASSQVGDAVEILCTTANTDFRVINSIGNITVT